MDLKTIIPTKAMCLVSLTALWLASAPAEAQTAPVKAPTASMPLGPAHMGATGPHDMRASMMMGMESMQQMPESGDTDKDFAMMKLHHEQTLNMAEMELANGKSSEMKAMARQIIAAQKKEIAQFEKWLAKQK